MTSWHEEIEFVEKFNELGNMLKEVFPAIEITGNNEKPWAIEQFDAYLQGAFY